MDKNMKLFDLAKKRQSFCWDGYKNIGDYHDGIYECDFVSPYTKSANNVEAKVMVFLQDWSSDDFLRGNIDKETVRLGYTPDRYTNKNLIDLLHNHFSLKLSDVYVTNLFPFIKPGSMKEFIPVRDMVRAAKEFGLPQIEIIAPKIIIALGLSTFNALYKTCEAKMVKNINDGVKLSPFYYYNSAIFCQAHTGMQGKNTRNKGGVNRVSTDWDEMAKFLLKAL